MSFFTRYAAFVLVVCSLPAYSLAGEFTLRLSNGGSHASTAALETLHERSENAMVVSIDKGDISNVLQNRPAALTLSLPPGSALPSTISVTKFSILTPYAKTVLMTESGEHAVDFAGHWASYKGQIGTDPLSTVVVTFSPLGVYGEFNLGSRRYILKTAVPSEQLYVLVEDNVKTNLQLRCGIDDSKNNSTPSKAIQSYPTSPDYPASETLIKSYLSRQSNLSDRMTANEATMPAISGDTIEVDVALDGDFSLYTARGSSFDSTTVTMLNAVAGASVVYLRDLSVSLKVSFTRVWSVAPPFAANDIFSALAQYKSYWLSHPDTVERTTAHLFSLKYAGSPGVGGYAFLNTLCDPQYGYAVTAVDTATTDYILTFAHELGHNFGAYHTHSCLWPNGPIDHCSDIEGGCSSGPLKDTIGTIMSYCSTREMKFNPIVSSLMRRVVETSWCALSTSAAPVAAADSSYLSALYNATGGSGWKNSKNWVSAPVKGRFGISVRGGRVVAIDLPANNLIGPLPAGLTTLTSLRKLNLSGRNFHHSLYVAKRDQNDAVFNQNTITGQIPSDINNLTALEYLDLSDNNFTGTIPAAIGSLTQLRWLNLSENYNLGGTIPASIANLQNLELFDVYRCFGLTGGIPAELTSLPQLRVLFVSENSSLGGTIPSQIGNLSRLYLLDLSGNGLTGSIPASITSITTLEQLLLENNKLTGSIPSDIGNLWDLNSIALNDNQLTGSIPASFTSLTKIGSLNLSNNKLNGSIPSSIGGMTNLLGLYLSNNSFSGTIPAALGNLSSLIEIDLSKNMLTGSIPDTLRNLGSSAPGDFGGLLMFNVGHNQLTGTVPSWLAQRTHLSQLDLGGNNFNPVGAFPQWILDLSSPVRLYLSGLGITGTIPATLMTRTSLNDLDLSNNQLTGPIPTTIGNLISLRILRLSGNQLTGPIPSQLSNIPYLSDIRLSNNMLTDTIPGFFSQYQGLVYLHLSHNKFSGRSPKHLVESSLLRELLLSNNDLTSLPDVPNTFLLHSDSTTIVRVDSNRVSFADVIPYVSAGFANLQYSPQQPTGAIQTLMISPASPVTLTVDLYENGNSYVWYKNGSLIDNAASSTYTIQSFAASDTGAYTAQVTNTGAPLLTMKRNPFFLKLNTSNLPGDLTLVFPLNGSPSKVDAQTVVHWNADPHSTMYTVEIDTADSFGSPVVHKDSIVTDNLVPKTLTPGKLYYWRVRGVNNNGIGNWSAVWSFHADFPSNASIAESVLPTRYELYQNFPNPFNPSTTISFALPQKETVTLRVYNILGQLVKTLADRTFEAGYYSIRFDAEHFSSGVYVYRIEAGTFSMSRRLVLLK